MSARDEALAEGARLLEDAACDADWTRTPDYCAGLRAGAELLLANTGEKATPAGATATPFFQRGRTYIREHRDGSACRFVCEHTTLDPKNGRREAWGWLHRSNGTRRRDFFWDDDYATWTLAEGGDL